MTSPIPSLGRDLLQCGVASRLAPAGQLLAKARLPLFDVKARVRVYADAVHGYIPRETTVADKALSLVIDAHAEPILSASGAPHRARRALPQ